MIKASHISKIYQKDSVETVALSDVSFEVKKAGKIIVEINATVNIARSCVCFLLFINNSTLQNLKRLEKLVILLENQIYLF